MFSWIAIVWRGCYDLVVGKGKETNMAYTLQERRDIVNSKMINSIASLISVPELMAIIHALNGDSIQNLTSFHDQFEFEFPINGDVIARLV